MKNNKTTIIFLISLVIALFTISVFVFLMKVVENKNIHIQSVSSALEEKETEKSQIDKIKKNADMIKESQDKINLYFVDSTNITTFINYLESVGSLGGTTLTVQNVDIPDQQGNQISARILIDGSFSNVMKTLQMMENVPYKVHFNSVYLNKNVSSDQNGQLNVKKMPKTYWEAQVSLNMLTS